MSTGVAQAVDAAGGQRMLAERLGVSQQSVSLWQKQGYAPLLRALEIEMIYGISRRLLISPRLRHVTDTTTEGDL